jgi:hypothetical protein
LLPGLSSPFGLFVSLSCLCHCHCHACFGCLAVLPAVSPFGVWVRLARVAQDVWALCKPRCQKKKKKKKNKVPDRTTT